MKLAEALMLRGDMQKKLASLKGRITLNAVVQDGDQPHEDPQELVKEAFMVLDQLEKLVTALNHANLQNKLPDGRTLTEAIARRDTLQQQHALLHAAISGTKREPDRYSTREIKWVATFNVAKLHEQADAVAKKIREINSALQETNWKVDLE